MCGEVGRVVRISFFFGRGFFLGVFGLVRGRDGVGVVFRGVEVLFGGRGG